MWVYWSQLFSLTRSFFFTHLQFNFYVPYFSLWRFKFSIIVSFTKVTFSRAFSPIPFLKLFLYYPTEKPCVFYYSFLSFFKLNSIESCQINYGLPPFFVITYMCGSTVRRHVWHYALAFVITRVVIFEGKKVAYITVFFLSEKIRETILCR